MAGVSASVAVEIDDRAYDDVCPEDDDWSTISVVGGRASRRVARSPVKPVPVPDDGSGRGSAVESVRALVNGLAGQERSLVRTAGERDVEVVAGTRTLPVLAGLREILPGGGLRRGNTIAVHTSSVLLAMLAAASKAGSWCAVVGLPALSPVAAAEMGIALERLALVPHPGTEWTTIVAALLDGFDIVVAAPPSRSLAEPERAKIAPVVAGRLAAKARQRGSVLIAAGPWAGADLTLAPVRGAWGGIGTGRGRLRFRELTVQARGRGAASAPREVTLQLPEVAGVLPPVRQPSQERPVELRRVG